MWIKFQSVTIQISERLLCNTGNADPNSNCWKQLSFGRHIQNSITSFSVRNFSLHFRFRPCCWLDCTTTLHRQRIYNGLFHATSRGVDILHCLRCFPLDDDSNKCGESYGSSLSISIISNYFSCHININIDNFRYFCPLCYLCLESECISSNHGR